MNRLAIALSLLLVGGLGAGPASAAGPDQALAAAQARLARIDRRAEAQQDERAIENLQRIYGYYLDRAEWDQVADLFATDGTIEFAQRGVYVGKGRVRQFLDLLGPQGPRTGHLDDHLQLQIVVHVAPDGQTAKLRARELNMGGDLGGSNHLREGTYENTLVKENGVWKFQAVHYYTNLNTDYDKGYGLDAQPIETASASLPPDRPPTKVYQAYPTAHVPPFHHPNPVTGQPVQYSGDYLSTPTAAPAAASPVAAAPLAAADADETIAKLEERIAATRLLIKRVNAYDEIENLESAYGYYLDKNLWNHLADLFAKDGSLELAQRGVYVGQDRIRAFLPAFGGAEGPRVNRLGNHLNLQPVITVAPDGTTAKVRSRLLQMMGEAGRSAGWGGAVYENEIVEEDGVWKFKLVHAYNTYNVAYSGGWSKQTRSVLPGPNATVPPDRPPTLVFEYYPKVYDLPIHYRNPVTGR